MMLESGFLPSNLIDGKNGAASPSDLAFATGRGPEIVADIEGVGRSFVTMTWSFSHTEMRRRRCATGAKPCRSISWLWIGALLGDSVLTRPSPSRSPI
jgi:hypothetical protein